MSSTSSSLGHFFPRGQLTQLQVTLFGGVSAVASKDSQHDDLNQLIDLLIDCPALEVLTLENCLPAMPQVDKQFTFHGFHVSAFAGQVHVSRTC